MSELTPDEAKWVKRVQRALDACPSDRIGFYTIGDSEVALYDKSKNVEHVNAETMTDFCVTVDDLDAGLGELKFPSLVGSTAG